MLDNLAGLISGELDCSMLARRLYSQDASLYQELPLGVVRPRDHADCEAIVRFAAENSIPLIPRAAGTSLAGQCVGAGLVVDISRHMTRILDIDPEKRIAKVQPGVVQDDLNDAAAAYGLRFAPDTSTSRQAMIGGMVGNNSCGAYSIIYGTTRDHVISLEAVLADGATVVFRDMNARDLREKRGAPNSEGRIYDGICRLLEDGSDCIATAFPDPRIARRNMGYALDLVGDPSSDASFSLLPLICGSEGTLCLVTEIEVKLVPLPKQRTLVCVHFDSVQQACDATKSLLDLGPAAIELMDGILLQATKGNREQSANRFWVEGDPGAVLAVELFADSGSELDQRVESVRETLAAERSGYAVRWIAESDIQCVWNLRKAALGILTGMPGDSRPITAIEDTAVAPEDLSDFIEQIHSMMKRFGKSCVYYGHAGAGVIHLRPMIDLKDPSEFEMFDQLMKETAAIVRRFNGSLSGEHGDGRLRSRLLKDMLGEECHALLVQTKRIFDPQSIMNPGKIVDAVDHRESLRAYPRMPAPEIETVFDWSSQMGFLRAVERCNGAGFCRQGPNHGAMCPSYMATKEEVDTTRGRANVLRQLLASATPDSTWSDVDLATAMSKCLSCKACAVECPASVDMARMKAEYLQKRIDLGDVGFRDRLFAFYSKGARLARFAPRLASGIINLRCVKRLLGIAVERQIPPFASETLENWFARRSTETESGERGRVVLFSDEFTNYTEPEVGRAAVLSLEKLGFEVELTSGLESGRSFISKGFLREARECMLATVEELCDHARAGTPIVGIEPSAILGFRDEAPDLVPAAHRAQALELREHCMLFEEFICSQFADGSDSGGLDLHAPQSKILLHGHCHQKSLAGMSATTRMLRDIIDAEVEEVPSGCCGMAGSFGYEREHYEISLQIGELKLFPAIRRDPSAIICASGTSCRQQIKAGTGRAAMHPAEILAYSLRILPSKL